MAKRVPKPERRPNRRYRADRDPDDEPSVPTRDHILTQLKARFDIAEDAERNDRREAILDDKFRNLEQWDPDIKRDREAREEPCLVIDHVNTPIHQVVNSHRNSRPGIKVVPRGGGASKKHALIRQGMIRQIEHDSYAPAIYAQAFDQAASGGWGFWRVNVEFVEDHPSDLEIRLDSILSRYQVRRDPTAKMPTREDARWWIIVDDMPLSEYKEEYPDSDVASADDLSGLGDEASEWITEDTVRVAEYWFRRKKKVRTFQLEDGTVRKTDTLDDKTVTGAQYRVKPRSRTTLPVTNHRDVDTSAVMWCKANAIELLEGNEDLTDAREWKGKYIPLIEMIGEQVVEGNRIHRRGMIRRMRDSQVMLNVEVSDLVVTQARSPKHVWSGFVGQFGSGPGDPAYDQYAAANAGRLPMVQAVPTEFGGQILPPPKLESYEPPIQNMVSGIQLASQFIRDTSGWYGAALGDLSPDRSGRAIDKLTRASEQSSSHYSFNFEIALVYTGRIILDLLPHVYDRPGRQVHMLGPKGEEDSVFIKQLYRVGTDGPIVVKDEQANLETDEFINLEDGKFAVTIEPGRSFATMRQEKADALQTVAQAAPNLIPVLAPDMVEALDFPGSAELADRIDAANPPHLRRQKPGQQAPPREIAEQMTQMEQVIKQLTEEVKVLHTEQQAKSAELASKEAIAARNNEVTLAVEEMKILAKSVSDAQMAAQAIAQQQFDALQARIGMQEQAAQKREEMILAALQRPSEGNGGPPAPQPGGAA